MLAQSMNILQSSPFSLYHSLSLFLPLNVPCHSSSNRILFTCFFFKHQQQKQNVFSSTCNKLNGNPSRLISFKKEMAYHGLSLFSSDLNIVPFLLIPYCLITVVFRYQIQLLE